MMISSTNTERAHPVYSRACTTGMVKALNLSGGALRE